MSAQMIQANIQNGKAQVSHSGAVGFTGRGNMQNFAAMMDALAAATLAKASEMKQQANTVTK